VVSARWRAASQVVPARRSAHAMTIVNIFPLEAIARAG
jgi:hypothetical protein